jgi:hypothetical protein
MATNLNPGADSTLVAAATNAAMADVPKDQALIWQGMSEARGKAYEAWGEAGNAAASLFMQHIGGEMVQDAAKWVGEKTDIGKSFMARRQARELNNTLREDLQRTLKDHLIERDGGINSNGDEIIGWRKEKDSEKRKELKRDWNNQWKNNIDQFNIFEAKTLENMSLASSGLVNLEATGGLGSLKQGALQAKGGWFGTEDGKKVRIRAQKNSDGDLEFHLESDQGGYVTNINADGSFGIETAYDDDGNVTKGGPKYKNLPNWAIKKPDEDAVDTTPISHKDQHAHLSNVVNNEIPASVKNALTNLPTNEDDIKTLQKDLMELGYDLSKYKDDGKMGNETRGALLDFKEDYNNIVGVLDEIGRNRIKISSSDVSGLVVQVNQQKRNALNQIDLDALSGKMPFRKNAIENQIMDILGNNANDWKDAMHARLGNKDKTYAQMLQEPTELSQQVFDSLKNIGAVDTDNDGDVDAQDFIGNDEDVRKNMAIMTNQLLNPSNPLAKKAFAEWYAGSVSESATSYIDKKTDAINKKNNKNLTNKNAATVISMGDDDKATASYSKKSTNHNLDVGVGDVVIGSDIMSKIIDVEFQATKAGQSDWDYKIDKDGVVWKSIKGNKTDGYEEAGEWIKSGINDKNDQYDKLVKYLADNKVMALDYKGGGGGFISWFDGGGDESTDDIVDQILGENKNVKALNKRKTKFNKSGSYYNLLLKESSTWNKNSSGKRELDTYIMGYGDDDFVAGTLGRHFGKDGFSFENTSAFSDGITAYYTDKNGKTHSKKFTTNYANSTKDKNASIKLQNWMMEMIEADIKAQSK